MTSSSSSSAPNSPTTTTWRQFITNSAVPLVASNTEDAVRRKYPHLLHPTNEHIDYAFRGRGGVGRDKTYFTTHRILHKSSKSIIGSNKRQRYRSMPYDSIQALTLSSSSSGNTSGTEDAGGAELKVWTKGGSMLTIEFGSATANAASAVEEGSEHDEETSSFHFMTLQQYLNHKLLPWNSAAKSGTSAETTPPAAAEAVAVAQTTTTTQLGNSSDSSGTSIVDWMGQQQQIVEPSIVEQYLQTQFPILLPNDEHVQAAAFPTATNSSKHGNYDLVVLTQYRYLQVTLSKSTLASLVGMNKHKKMRLTITSIPWSSIGGYSITSSSTQFQAQNTEIKLYTTIADYPVVHHDFTTTSTTTTTTTTPLDLTTIQTCLSSRLLFLHGGGDGRSSKSTIPPPPPPVDNNDNPKSMSWFQYHDNKTPSAMMNTVVNEMNHYYHTTVPLLLPTEHVEMVFQGRRHIVLCTTYRVVVLDPQVNGLKSNSVEYASIPWTSVVAFGIKTSGIGVGSANVDRNCEVLLYTNMMFDPPSRDDEPPRPGMSFWELDVDPTKISVSIMAIKKYLATRCMLLLDHNNQKSAATSTKPAPSSTVDDVKNLEELLSRMGNSSSTTDDDNGMSMVDPAEYNKVFHTSIPILLDNDETTIMAFRAGKDLTLFTSHRIVVLDAEGWSGDKVLYRSIPYHCIQAFTAQSAGGWDRDAELSILTLNQWSLNKLQIDFRKGKADIVSIQKFLASVVMLDNRPHNNNDKNEDMTMYRLNSILEQPQIQKGRSIDLDSVVTFFTGNSKEEDADAVNEELHTQAPILLDDVEKVERAFRSGRDLFVYTNLRVLLVNVLGLQGTAIEYQSYPWYKWCHGFEIETAGHLDRDAELYLYSPTSARRRIMHSILVKRCDIHEMQAYVRNKLLFPAESR